MGKPQVIMRSSERTLFVQAWNDVDNAWVDFWTGSPNDTIDWVETSVMPDLEREHPGIKLRLIERVTETVKTVEVVS